MEAELVPPSKEEAYELFDEFNDLENGKEKTYIEKDEFERFASRIIEMLEATIEK